MAPRSFAFLLNLSEIEDAESRILITSPLHRLRKARTSEIGIIRSIIQSHFPYPVPISSIIYESKPNDSGTNDALPELQWRYFVLEYEGSNSEISRLEHAFGLCDNPIYIGFERVRFLHGRGFTFNQPSLSNALQGFSTIHKVFRSLSKSDIDTIREIYHLMVDFDFEKYKISFQFSQLKQLRSFITPSLFTLLGYFGVLESLITHKPNENDPYSSLTRQVTAKCSLINKRFSSPVDYTRYFGSVNTDKVWKRLYALRSCIAHGMKPDFSTGDFSCLGNFNTTTQFIVEFTNKLAVHSMKEPDLLMDLKKC